MMKPLQDPLSLLAGLLRADFTAGMETTLDEISVGKLEWQSYLIGWHQSYFQPMLARAYTNLGAGLSLGDRACLALGKRLNLPVLTADKVWTSLSLGITINLIR